MKPKLTEALRAIIGRSDEIVALAENDEQNLPEIFSFRQNNITIKACLEAVDAVADSSPKELANCRGLIAETQEHVTAANNALSERVIRNPLMMNAFIAAENWVFAQLHEAGPEFIGLARLVRRFNLITRGSRGSGTNNTVTADTVAVLASSLAGFGTNLAP